MSDFGDITADDAFDPSPPDPEQVAIRLHELRTLLDSRIKPWRQLDEAERQVAIALMILIIEWLQRQGSLRSG